MCEHVFTISISTKTCLGHIHFRIIPKTTTGSNREQDYMYGWNGIYGFTLFYVPQVFNLPYFVLLNKVSTYRDLCFVRLNQRSGVVWLGRSAEVARVKLCLHELLHLSCAVERHYFKRKFYIEVASLDCFTLVAKACQIKYLFLLMYKFFPTNLAFPS